MSLILTTVAPAIFGAFLRIWAEERKDAGERRKFEMALLAQRTDLLKETQKNVAGSTFLQFMVMLMTMTALGAFVVFPIVAVLLDVDLYITHTWIKDTGFLFWSGTKEMIELIPIEGLYLPEDFHLIIQGAVSLIFGNVTAGMGRR